MRFKKIALTLLGLGAVAGTTIAVVACGKTANATLPVEFVVAGSGSDASYVFRTDRGDGRISPGAESWNKEPAAKASTDQAVFQSSVAQGIVSAFKAVIAAYVGSYGEIDPGWVALFDDVNGQRSGSGSLMVEMSRIYMANVGQLFASDGTTVSTSIGKGEKGVAKFTVQQMTFDGYSTTGNSPAESYDSLLSPSNGHHWVVDFAAVSDPVVLTVAFTNNSDTPVTSISGINYGALDSYVICASKLAPQLSQDQYRAIVNAGPSAANNYKGRIGDADFKKIFGATVKPVKKTS